MYNLNIHKTDKPEELLNFVGRYPFAFLTATNAEGNPVATQVPLLVEEREGKWFLQGHIMRNTDHHRVFQHNSQVLAVFTGPQAYVSARRYSNPHMGSTWNYMSVHINGKMRFLNEEEKANFMRRFSLHFENGNQESPTVFDNLSESYQKKMMPAIDAFEIESEKIDHVFKLSQDRDALSRKNIIEALYEKGGMEKLLAIEMQRIENVTGH